jgi:hypothetical protein
MLTYMLRLVTFACAYTVAVFPAAAGSDFISLCDLPGLAEPQSCTKAESQSKMSRRQWQIYWDLLMFVPLYDFDFIGSRINSGGLATPAEAAAMGALLGGMVLAVVSLYDMAV